MAVAYFIAKDGSTVISMDCVKSFTKSRSNTITNYSVMSGANVSDTYHINNRSFQIEGLVTSIKTRNANLPSPSEFQTLIDEIVLSYTRFELFGNDLIPSVKTCVITDESYVQDVYEDTITVSLGVKEVYITDQAIKGEIPITPSSSTEGQLASEVDGGSGNKTKTSIFTDLKNLIVDLTEIDEEE